MLDLAKEKDIEVLRQAALLLERENQRLTAKLVALTKQRLLAEGKEQLTRRLEEIQRQLAVTHKKLYGTSLSSDRVVCEKSPALHRRTT